MRLDKTIAMRSWLQAVESGTGDRPEWREICRTPACHRRIRHEDTWCGIAGEPAPKSDTAPRVSRGGAKDAIPYERVGSSWVNPDGNRNVPYLYEDDDGRKLNLNWDDPENRWNQDDLFLVVRNSLHVTPKDACASRQASFQFR